MKLQWENEILQLDLYVGSADATSDEVYGNLSDKLVQELLVKIIFNWSQKTLMLYEKIKLD